jgi:hypothetical protein
VTFFLLFLSFLSSASGPCGDFFSYACMQGNQGRDDGTGTVRSTTQLQGVIADAVTAEQARFTAWFGQRISTNAEWRSRIYLAAGCQPGGTPSTCPNFFLAISQVAAWVYRREVNSSFGVSRTGAFAFTDGIDQQVHNTPIVLPLNELQFFRENSLVTSFIDESIQRLDGQLVPTERRNFVRDTAFPEVRNGLLEVIRQLPESPQREAMIARVNAVTVQTEYCSGERHDILQSNAYYNLQNNSLNICLNYLFRSTSLFSLYRVLAHEIAHSIDPCKDISGNVFQPLVNCLHRPAGGGTPRGCSGQRGQIGEMFCDWMAGEVFARIQRTNPNFANLSSHQFGLGMANSRPACEYSHFSNPRDPSRSHPRSQERLNTLVSNPTIRARMGCSNTNPQLTYCPITGIADEDRAPPSIDDTRSVQ